MSIQACFMCGLLIFPGLAFAACKPPTEKTKPAPTQAELVISDGNGKDFQLYSKSQALLIGQSSYSSAKKGMTPLPSVPSELRKIKTVLEAQDFDVSMYLDLDSKDFNETIDCYFKLYKSDAESRFLFFYAGHGITLKNITGRSEGYVLPIDISSSPSDDEIKSKGFRLAKFVEEAQAIQAKHALFVFDSCFSGSILNSPGRSPVNREERPAPANYITSSEAQKPQREFLASGSEEQTVPSSSVFAELFAKALLGERRDADQNQDGFLTGTELITFLKQTVADASDSQTPTSGRLKDDALNKGEYVFKIVQPKIVARQTEKSVEPPSVSLRPLFRGNVSTSGTKKTIIQQFAIDTFLRTENTDCSKGCQDRKKIQTRKLLLSLPSTVPANAVLDDPELSCVDGQCDGFFNLISPPLLSADRKSVAASVETWGPSSSWRLSAKLVVPSTGDAIQLVDRATDSARSIPLNSATISAGKTETLTLDENRLLKDLILAIQSDDTKIRRAARAKLSDLISLSGFEFTTELIRGFANGTYRYKLGVSFALGASKDGWSSIESASRTILQNEHDRKDQDLTLKLSLANALANQRLFAYYELGTDKWLTPWGQLRKSGIHAPPLEDFSQLKKGDLLFAASAVNLRAGVGTASSIVETARAGNCFVVVKPDRKYLGTSASGGWLEVRKSIGCT